MSNLNGDTLVSQKISEVQDIEHKLIPYSPQRMLEYQAWADTLFFFDVG